ncbi:hypothetical protein [Pseudonocardia sp. H11422]|uniref:hypothetical protein n=1 Tax=Pseudonocardia sp. H11422 TaxID=2835866 RepID=UPI001BDCB33F|nr:hypothetical protein [Pseudonocardia sp. H11422]
MDNCIGATAEAVTPLPSLSDVQIVVPRHCDGRNWVVDACCSTIYISGRLTLADAVEALQEATAAVHRDAVRQQLRLVEPLPDVEVTIPSPRPASSPLVEVSR